MDRVHLALENYNGLFTILTVVNKSIKALTPEVQYSYLRIFKGFLLYMSTFIFCYFIFHLDLVSVAVTLLHLFENYS